jgi:hypothetical protein
MTGIQSTQIYGMKWMKHAILIDWLLTLCAAGWYHIALC